jgi:hypothetical protein
VPAKLRLQHRPWDEHPLTALDSVLPLRLPAIHVQPHRGAGQAH